jgi:hypothetical protein
MTYEYDGYNPAWRGIHSRDHADNPYYPEKFSALGIRIAVNYIGYAMTH